MLIKKYKMKRLLFFALFIPATFYSQDKEASPFYLKPYIGTSNSFQFGETINSNDEKKSRKSFTFGIHTETTLSSKFSAVIGLQYNRMGSTLIDYPILPYYDGRVEKDELDYINFPILIKYKLGSMNQWNIQGGIVVGRLLNSKSNGEDNSHFINRGQVSAHLGIGYVHPLNEKLALTIDQQNLIGLTKNTANNNGYMWNGSVAYTPKIYNFYSSINLGLEIKFN